MLLKFVVLTLIMLPGVSGQLSSCPGPVTTSPKSNFCMLTGDPHICSTDLCATDQCGYSTIYGCFYLFAEVSIPLGTPGSTLNNIFVMVKNVASGSGSRVNEVHLVYEGDPGDPGVPCDPCTDFVVMQATPATIWIDSGTPYGGPFPKATVEGVFRVEQTTTGYAVYGFFGSDEFKLEFDMISELTLSFDGTLVGAYDSVMNGLCGNFDGLHVEEPIVDGTPHFHNYQAGTLEAAAAVGDQSNCAGV